MVIRKFGARLPMRCKKAARVGDGGLRDARRKNAGSSLLVFLGHFRDAGDGAGAVRRRRVGSVLKIARGLGVFCGPGIGKSRSGLRGWLRADDFAVSTTRRSDSSSVLLVVARAVRFPSQQFAPETLSTCSATF